jgi:hypothetical protein
MVRLMRKVLTNGHQIEIKTLGTEIVKYDGRVVSKMNTMVGGLHTFNVVEDGKEVQYEIQVGTKLLGLSTWVVARRNGVVFFSDK